MNLYQRADVDGELEKDLYSNAERANNLAVKSMSNRNNPNVKLLFAKARVIYKSLCCLNSKNRLYPINKKLSFPTILKNKIILNIKGGK